MPGILDLIEQPELVIIDLSRGRPNVTYEAALVHALGLPHVLITEDRRPPSTSSQWSDPNRFHMVTLSELGDALPAIGVTR